MTPPIHPREAPARAALAATSIAAARARRPRAPHRELGRELGLTEVEVLAALPAEAFPADAARLGELLDEVRGWGRLRVVIQSRLAVAELLVDLAGATLEREGLTVRGADFEAHLPLLQASSVYFVERPGHGQGLSRALAFVGDDGEVFVRLFLLKTREQDDYPAEQLARFEAARTRFQMGSQTPKSQ